MRSERSKLSILLRCWERRIGSRLNCRVGHCDPVKEINSSLLPNDHHEARFAFLRLSVTSYRSLVWPFTPPLSGFRYSLPTEEV